MSVLMFLPGLLFNMIPWSCAHVVTFNLCMESFVVFPIRCKPKTYTKPMLMILVKLRHLNCKMEFFIFQWILDTCVLSVCVDHHSGQCSCSRHGAVELVVFIVQSDGNYEQITIISIKMSTTKGSWPLAARAVREAT